MMRYMPKGALAALFLSFALAASAPLPLAWAAPENPKQEQDKSDTYRLLELFGDVFERVRADYVEEVSDEELIEAAIQGMMTSLDPHSSYLNKKNFREMQVQTKGEFGGLGIEVTMENGYVKVVSPIDDTPAFRAGLKAGDLITHIDSEQVQGLTLSQAVEKMRGPVNTDIKLTIRRGADEVFDVNLTRDKIHIQSVRSRIEGDVGYIRITSFSEQTSASLKTEIERILKEKGDTLLGFVLDLRNNPGGLLDQAVAVADTFLDQGEIVSTRGRTEDNAQRFNATAGDALKGLPMIVLINGGSASASEIVAGALQDHRRAILLGTKSFGKGSVQTIIPLGRNGAIKLTTQRYYTPSGRSIQARGIDPDIVVQQAKIEPIEQTRKLRSEADLRGALPNEQEKKKKQEAKPEPQNADKIATSSAETPQDFQLSRALDLLHGIGLYRNRMVN